MNMKKLFSALFALVVFLFWMFVLPYHVHYQEEIQIFPYTWLHLKQCLCYPGGLASYLAEFCVQFFYIGWLGALILAALLCLLQLETWRVVKVFNPSASVAWYPVSFIPAVCSLAFLCDAGNLPSAIVALILVCEAFVQIRSSRLTFWVLSVVVMYYLAGPFAFILALCGIVKLGTDKSHKLAYRVLFGVVMVFTCVLVIAVSASVFLKYPVRYLTLGVEYSHIPGQYTASFWTLCASIPAVVAFVLVTSTIKLTSRTQLVVLVALSLVVAAGSYAYVNKHVSKEMESIYAYDYCAANRQWDTILQMAEKKTPRTPSEVICLNLALVMTGESGDRLFDFFQSGIPGLFPNYDTYVFLKFTGAEALYQAGLLNMALHYSFEAYQTFPGGRESARHLKRMAEVNMIKGVEDVAEKYLKLLSRTLFYGAWAREYLNDQSLIAENPEYLRLLGCRNSDPDIFDDMYDFPKQAILRSQVAKSGKADQSYHYLLAYDLLDKDPESFASDFGLAAQDSPIPEIYQEALLVPWITAGGHAEYDADLISPKVLGKAQAFLKDLQTGRTTAYMKTHYGRTFWFYYSSK